MVAKASDIRQRASRARLVSFSVIAVLVLLFLPLGVLLFASKVFDVKAEPVEIADDVGVRVEEGFAFAVGTRLVLISSEAQLRIAHPGFQDASVTVHKGSAQSVIRAILQRLGGVLEIEVEAPFRVSTAVNGAQMGRMQHVELEPGEHQVEVFFGDGDLLLESRTVVMEGRGVKQNEKFNFSSSAVRLQLETQPADAEILLSGHRLGQSSYRGAVPMGSHTLIVRREGYREFSEFLELGGRNNFVNRGIVTLDPLPVPIEITTSPANASIFVDNKFVAESGRIFRLPPGRIYEGTVSKAGFRDLEFVLEPQPGKEYSQHFDLSQDAIQLRVTAEPRGTVLLNGQARGTAPLTLTATTGDEVTVQHAGYASLSQRVAHGGGNRQSLHFALVTVEEDRYDKAPDAMELQGGLVLRKFPALRYTKFLSDEAPPRTEVEMSRPFYISETEVTVGAYRLFDPSINGVQTHPVSNLTWMQAIQFCNWLSEQNGLAPFYRFGGRGELQGIDEGANGLRLPSEAEWELAASFDWKSRNLLEPYEWGAGDFPPRNFANIAGAEAKDALASTIKGYRDDHRGVAPVRLYAPNANGMYDMTGNVAEWVHDAYSGHRVPNPGSDYLGPDSGAGRMYKGSSFETADFGEIRVAFRGQESFRRATLGFRVARWLY